MSREELYMMLSPEDKRLVRLDELIHGEFFVSFSPDGTAHRIDPAAVTLTNQNQGG